MGEIRDAIHRLNRVQIIHIDDQVSQRQIGWFSLGQYGLNFVQSASSIGQAWAVGGGGGIGCDAVVQRLCLGTQIDTQTSSLGGGGFDGLAGTGWHHRASAERDDLVIVVQCDLDLFDLGFSEGRFAMFGPDVADGHAPEVFNDAVIGIDEGHAQPLGEQPPDGGFARPAITEKDEIHGRHDTANNGWRLGWSSVTVLSVDPAAKTPIWVTPIDLPGLPNLHQVSPVFFRGAQPDELGVAELKKLGVKTDINPRLFHSDRDILRGSGLNYEHIYSKAWHPEDEDIVRFLKLATDPANQPVFVHCQHGADRTGVCCAAYRIVVQGWTKDQAIAEMTRGGFGFHPVWQDLMDYPRPVAVVWAGFVVGCGLPLVMWAIAGWTRWRWSSLPRFFAGFCLVGNGAYLAAGYGWNRQRTAGNWRGAACRCG